MSTEELKNTGPWSEMPRYKMKHTYQSLQKKTFYKTKELDLYQRTKRCQQNVMTEVLFPPVFHAVTFKLMEIFNSKRRQDRWNT